MEAACAPRNNLPWILKWKPLRMTKTRDNHRALGEISASIKELSLYLDNHESAGKGLTASEIHTLATKLQAYVEELLAASKSLRDDKSAG
jgi:hypothetical protein